MVVLERFDLTLLNPGSCHSMVRKRPKNKVRVPRAGAGVVDLRAVREHDAGGVHRGFEITARFRGCCLAQEAQLVIAVRSDLSGPDPGPVRRQHQDREQDRDTGAMRSFHIGSRSSRAGRRLMRSK